MTPTPATLRKKRNIEKETTFWVKFPTEAHVLIWLMGEFYQKSCLYLVNIHAILILGDVGRMCCITAQ